MKDDKDKFSLKDHLFNIDRVRYLASQFSGVDSQFDGSGFVRKVMKRLGELELKQRIVWIAETLEQFLPEDYPSAAKLILAALPPELDPTLSDDDFGDFIIAPLGEIIVRRGISDQHLALSLKMLKEITKRFSMEDALRAFINAHPEKTLRELAKWTRDRNYHVRRLVSEGTRPRLPWSGRLSIDFRLPLPFLNQLHADSTRYVTRSVANHLNDIAKLDPELVLETLKRWCHEGKQNRVELEWICRHSLRTLIKQGHSQTMEFLGLSTAPQISISDIELDRSSIRAGEELAFAVTITALRDESLVVDYVIDFVKANGRHAPKVFKWKKLALEVGQSTLICKRHHLRADATTYKLFSGTHRLTIQVNGVAAASTVFEIQ